MIGELLYPKFSIRVSKMDKCLKFSIKVSKMDLRFWENAFAAIGSENGTVSAIKNSSDEMDSHDA
jgi:hypothetical protein